MADTSLPRFRNPQGSISGLLQQLFTDLPSESEFTRGLEARELDLREQKTQAELQRQQAEQEMLQTIAQKYRATLESSRGDHKAAILEVLPDLMLLPSSTTANAMRANLEMIQQLAMPRQVLGEGQMVVNPLSGETVVGQVPRQFAPQTLSPGQVLVDPSSGREIARAPERAQAAAPTFPGLTDEQQQIVQQAWHPDKPGEAARMAASFLKENEQRLSMMRDTETSLRVVMNDAVAIPERLSTEAASAIINDPNAGAIERSIALLDSAGNWAAGRGEVLSRLPNSVARQMKSELDTLKSMVSFNRLLEIKKSGAGLGALSDSELNLLGASLGSLDQGLPPEVLRARLTTVRSLLSKVRDNIASDMQRFTSPVSPASAGQQNARPIQFRRRPDGTLERVQ